MAVDPSATADGSQALDWWFPSPDGAYVAYGLARDGSEDDTLYVRDVENKRDLSDKIERANAASLAWLPDDSGFYYTKNLPRREAVKTPDDLKHRHVYFHKLGDDPARDAQVKVDRFGDTEFATVAVSPDGHWLVLRASGGPWLKDLTKPESQLVQLETAYDAVPRDDALYVRGGGRAWLYTVDYGKLEKKAWKELIPEGSELLWDYRFTSDGLVALQRSLTGMRLLRYGKDGKSQGEVKVPYGSTLAPTLTSDPRGHEAFVLATTAYGEEVVYRIDTQAGTVSEWDKVKIPRLPKWIVKEQLWAQSKDETAVPVYVYRPKGKALDGKTPTVLVGYGGFRTNMLERAGAYGALAELGMTIAVMGLRGGSELGEGWHEDGMGKHKQHTFDDAIAIAEMLIARKYTDAAHLGILGASNGGLLVGACITQRPDLFRAAVSQVGLQDMLRFEQFRIGRLWIGEYGDPEDPQEFKWLWAYSPYHHVVENTAYPAVLLTASENDPRVDPMHARKMTAALQWATASGRPVLLKLDKTGGHGIGKGFRSRIDELTDIFGFFLDQFGVPVE